MRTFRKISFWLCFLLLVPPTLFGQSEGLNNVKLHAGDEYVFEEFFFKDDGTVAQYCFRNPIIKTDKKLPADLRDQPTFEIRLGTWKLEGKKLRIDFRNKAVSYQVKFVSNRIYFNDNPLKKVDSLRFFTELKRMVPRD